MVPDNTLDSQAWAEMDAQAHRQPQQRLFRGTSVNGTTLLQSYANQACDAGTSIRKSWEVYGCIQSELAFSALS